MLNLFTEFDQVPAGEGRVTKRLEVQTVNFNICKNPAACLCHVTVLTHTNSQITAGQEEIIRMAELELNNAGTEPSPSSQVEVILDQANYQLQHTTNCQTVAASTSHCHLTVRERNVTRFPLYISPTRVIQHDVTDISVRVSVTTDCEGRSEQVFSGHIVVPVVHKWTIEPAQDPAQQSNQLSWSEETSSDNKSLSASLKYDLTNIGPSTSSIAHIYVFLPRDPLVRGSRVTLASRSCPEGDRENLQRPPVTSSFNSLSCRLRGDCLVYHCIIEESLQRLETERMEVSFEFDKSLASQRSEVKWRVVTSVCVLSRDQSDQNDIVCQDDPTHRTLSIATEVQFYPQSPLDVLIGYWQLLVGVGSSILVFLIVLLLAWKFDLFQRVRIVKKESKMENTDNRT